VSNLHQDVRNAFVTFAWNQTFTIVAMIALTFAISANSADAGLSGGPANPSEESPAMAARWEGYVQIPGTEMKMVIDLAQNSEGAWIGSAVIPGFDVKGAALRDLVVDGSEVSFVIKGSLGDPKLTGHIDAKGALTGEFQEAGNSAPFLLERAGPPQVDPPPQSTPVRKELEGEWQGDFELPGRTLHVSVTLANQASGRATAKFHIKGVREYDLPVDLVTEEDELLTIESPSAHFIYQGWIRQSSREINGELQLGPYDVSLVLHPAAKNSGGQKP
jgi:hypothetical protein